MPYALFCNEAKLSKAYPTEADVWKLAVRSGLVVDNVSEHEKPSPRPVLDNDYEIRPCRWIFSSIHPERSPVRDRTLPQPAGNRRKTGRVQIAGLSLAFAFLTGSACYGVATARDACSAASATQAFLRCSPRIAPVTLSTFPAGHEASCTKAIS